MPIRSELSSNECRSPRANKCSGQRTQYYEIRETTAGAASRTVVFVFKKQIFDEFLHITIHDIFFPFVWNVSNGNNESERA